MIRCVPASILAGDIQAYIDGLKRHPTLDDPAVLFAWEDDGVREFVQSANQGVVGIAQPAFISTAPGQMTAHSFKNDLIAKLAQVAGGRYGNALLAPNTLDQFGRIMAVLARDVEHDPWMQAVAGMRANIIQPLAVVYRLADRVVSDAVPTGMVAPAGLIQLFQ